jgi:sec-independent protein translocase protein TatB
MFDIGFTELMLAAVVALVVLGPERMPKAARFAGLWVRKARAQWDSVKGELEREIASDDIRRSVQESREALRELDEGVRATGDDARREFDALRQAATAEQEAFDDDVPRRLESASMPDFADELPVPDDAATDDPLAATDAATDEPPASADGAAGVAADGSRHGDDAPAAEAGMSDPLPAAATPDDDFDRQPSLLRDDDAARR